MISNDAELLKAQGALSDLYKALASLRHEIGEARPKVFSLLAEGPLYEIDRLHSEIEEYTGASILRHEGAPLWLRLVGPMAQWGETSSSVLVAFLNSLRTGVQSIAGFNVSGRINGRPSVELQKSCDFELVGFAPGSFEVGMRLPEPAQQELFLDSYQSYAAEGLRDFLRIAKWASSSDSLQVLGDMISDVSKRRVLLRALKPFVPRRSGGIDFLELSGTTVSEYGVIRITQTAIDRIAEGFKSAISEEEERYEGEIREIDLDKKTFHLRNVEDVGDVLCKFAEDMILIAAENLGGRVRVIGKRIKKDGVMKGSFVVVDMEKIDEATD